MRKAAVMAQCERRLVELGCPALPTGRKLRELADHHEDLKQNALEEGLSEADANARADQLLGEPVALAEYLAAALRQSSWWGRHPVIGFCLLPPLAISALFMLGLALDSLIGKIYFTPDQLSALAGAPGLKFYTVVFEGTYYAAITLAAILFCQLARRTVAGLQWALITAAVCALDVLLFYVNVAPHELNIGYSTRPHWLCSLIPLAVTVAFWFRQLWIESNLAPLPVAAGNWRAKKSAVRRAHPPANLRGSRRLTPTTIALSLVIVGILIFASWFRADILKQRARLADLHHRVWPAERATETARIAARQLTIETSHAVPIDLSPRINAALTDSLFAISENNGNHLAQFPAGLHTFGGVPFDVRGKIQLLGRGLLDSGGKFPVQARNIAIAQKCQQIHLLHGVSFINEATLHATIARLVLHYADGSQAEIPINAGQHVLDWWGPIYTTQAPMEDRTTSDPGTELAWTGSNPWIRKTQPEDSLRIYKSTFANPQPDLEISTIDYVSTLTQAAPFLLGLTLE